MEATTTAGRDKGYKGLPLEGPLARWYAKNTAKDLKEFRRLAGTLVSRVGPGSAVLEVAPGPGHLAIELAKLGPYRVTGLDISRSFVRMAGENARREGVAVDFRHGNAAAMPLDSDSFDLLVCRAAFKNFSEPVKALDEMHQVLKPGGEAVIIDLRSDVRPAEIDAYLDGMRLGWLDRFMTKWIFRHMLIKRAYTSDQFREMAAASRFGSCTIEESPIGLEVTLRKPASSLRT
jgi:ubiquinone/menaquinone biosynthesis C-methylase UbiE